MTIPVDRRAFLAQCAVWPLAAQLRAEQPAEKPTAVKPTDGDKRARPPIDPELLKHVHPDMRYVRPVVPDADNAWPLWTEAQTQFVDVYKLGLEIQAADALLDATCSREAKLPGGELGRLSLDWFARNRMALDLFDAGLIRRRYQQPERFGVDPDLTDTSVPRNFEWLKATQIRILLADGKRLQAVREAKALFRASEMLRHGADTLLRWSIGAGIGGIRFHLNWLTETAAMPDEELAQIQALLERALATDDGLRQALRGDYHVGFLWMLSNLPDGGTVEQLVDQLLDEFWLYGGTVRKLQKVDENDLARRRQGIVDLLRANARPLDRANTVRLSSGVMAQVLRELDVPWPKRRKDFVAEVRKEVEPWPRGLSFVWSFERDAAKEKQAAVSAEQIAAVRYKLKGVENPVGKLLLVELAADDFTLSARPYYRVRLEVMRLMLAIRRYEIARKELPGSLADVVGAKLLSAVPTDPFADKPFGYSKKLRRVWSVGSDAKTDPASKLDDPGNPHVHFIWEVGATHS